MSSSTVYERASEFPTPEEHAWECPPPLSAYGFSKLTGEMYCRAAADEHGLPYTICRPFNAYGPGGPDDAVIPDLIRKSLAGMNPMPIYGTGEQTRTFTWLDDVADGIGGSRACSPRRLARLGEDAQVAAVDLAALAHPRGRGALVGDADLVIGVAQQAVDDRRAEAPGSAGDEHALHAGEEAG